MADLCAALAVARRGSHAWAARAPGPRAQANAILWPLIEQAGKESRQTYGRPRLRLWLWLGRKGLICSRPRVARRRRGHRRASQTKRRFRVSWTDSHHDLPIAPPSPARHSAAGLVHHSDAACNMPAPPTGHGWRRRECSRA